MAIVRFDPFAELNALHEQLNSVFNDTFGDRRVQQFYPVTDVYQEDDKQLVVEAHLPQFSSDEINIDVHNNALEIRAEHSQKDESAKKRRYLVRESSTSFYRRVALPKHADTDGIKADFKDGVLKVSVPFKELPKPKRIAIGSGKAK
ncbi:MAG: Hsp20/alpha crystallin family protein [Candidatus Chaera renei]|uniref:Hsp20/alpha crystallin family protein n=1 Tax=Candidatus Chaera renei TaxID=2506947 RepID=A0A4Q0AIZ8_9BACT|nr:MAG: Hsp20/alpha crystallin family protein [Candidatus Chaera renei]